MKKKHNYTNDIMITRYDMFFYELEVLVCILTENTSYFSLSYQLP